MSNTLQNLASSERLLKPNKSFGSVCLSVLSLSCQSSIICIATVYSYLNISVMLDGRFGNMTPLQAVVFPGEFDDLCE